MLDNSFLRYCIVCVSETNYEFYMNNTIASNNTQHGVYLENIRNYVMVNASTISYNGYGAGLCVYGGAGATLVHSFLIHFTNNHIYCYLSSLFQETFIVVFIYTVSHNSFDLSTL